MPFAVSDAVSGVLHTALNGVSARQRVVADNIANVDTPGFLASSVNFESSLRAAINRGDFTDGRADVDMSPTPTDAPAAANGNNVDLREETLTAMQSQFGYQVLTRAVTDRRGWITASTAR